jgi:hypothetical protein
MPMKFIATPDPGVPGLNGNGLEAEFLRVSAAAAGQGYTYVGGWRSLDALFQSIKNTLDTNNFDCIELLEIDAHGSPALCDGVSSNATAAFGALLRTVRLCDEVRIYLSGCNTGVRIATSESLAQLVSRQTPTEAVDNVRVTVYGSVGYLSGTNMEGNATTGRDARVDCHYYPPYPDVTDGGTRYPGSSDAAGAASYRGFREGRPV